MLLLRRSIGIHLVERVLVEIVLADGARSLKRQPVAEGQRVDADKADDLFKLALLLQDVHSRLHHLRPILAHVLVEPAFQPVEVQGVALKPVDCREMARVCKLARKAPEHLHGAQRGLRNRLGDIAARRGYRADGRDRAGAPFGAERDDNARALIELGKAAAQIGRVALFTGHFFQAAGHFAQRLRPTGGGIRHDGDLVAHVAEVFRNGDAGVDGSLTRRNGHIGGVGDEHRALHQ